MCRPSAGEHRGPSPRQSLTQDVKQGVVWRGPMRNVVQGVARRRQLTTQDVTQGECQARAHTGRAREHRSLTAGFDLSSVVVIIVGPMLVNITSRPTFLGRHLFRYPSEIIPEITPEVSRSHPGALALTLLGDR